MQLTLNTRAVALRSALVTPLCLIGSVFVGGLLGDVLHAGLGHLAEDTRIALAVIPALLAVIGGGALWGRAIARITQVGDARRMTWAGALGYGPTVILVALGLTVLENLIVEQRRVPDLPIHVVFTLLFAPAALVVAAIGALALGVALKDKALLARLAIGSGLAAGITFLVVNLLMDALGWRVGAPGAAERATMLTVMLTSNLAASLAAGAVIGWLLARRQRV